MRNPILFTLVALALINALALLTYGWDKARAQRGHRRISERMLLLWTLLGGAGALTGIFRLRHKSRKPSFLALAVPLAIMSLLAQFWLLRRLF